MPIKAVWLNQQLQGLNVGVKSFLYPVYPVNFTHSIYRQTYGFSLCLHPIETEIWKAYVPHEPHSFIHILILDVTATGPTELNNKLLVKKLLITNDLCHQLLQGILSPGPRSRPLQVAMDTTGNNMWLQLLEYYGIFFTAFLLFYLINFKSACHYKKLFF